MFLPTPHSTLPPRSRTRFLCKDIIELRRSKWIPRRKADKARKIEEIHAEAQAELGMIPTMMNLTSLAPDLPGAFPVFFAAGLKNGVLSTP